MVAFRWAMKPLLYCGGFIFFSGILPLEAADLRAQEETSKLRGGDGGMTAQAHGRVLLVDDEALIRMGMRTILHSLGYEVVGEAANGQDALEKVATLHPDVVIMDLKMPVLDGLEATRVLCERHQLSEAQASARLRRLAKNSRRTVAEIAEAILTLEPP